MGNSKQDVLDKIIGTGVVKFNLKARIGSRGPFCFNRGDRTYLGTEMGARVAGALATARII